MPVVHHPAVPEVTETVVVSEAVPAYVHIDVKLTVQHAKFLAALLAIVQGGEQGIGLSSNEVWPDWWEDRLFERVEFQGYFDGRYQTKSYKDTQFSIGFDHSK